MTTNPLRQLHSRTSGCRALAALACIVAATDAAADVGFTAALVVARSTAPNEVALAIRSRNVAGVDVYEVDLVDRPPGTLRLVTINADSGTLASVELLPLAPADAAAASQAIQRLQYARIDFPAAIGAAEGWLGTSDTEVVEVLYEQGVVAYRTRDQVTAERAAVDCITGTVVPDPPPGFGVEPVVTVAEMAGAIAHAERMAGPGWRAIEARASDRPDGTTVRVLLGDAQAPAVREVEVLLGIYVGAPAAAPLPHQAALVAAVGDGGAAGHFAIDALIAAERAAPRCGVTRIGLEHAGGKGALRWRVSLVAEDATARDAATDALAPPPPVATLGQRIPVPAGDIDRDGDADAADLGLVLGGWGGWHPSLDLDASGSVSGADLAVVLGSWGG
jgi:hypothetical protein